MVSKEDYNSKLTGKNNNIFYQNIRGEAEMLNLIIYKNQAL